MISLQGTLHCRKVARKRQMRKSSTSIRRKSLENDVVKIVNGHLILSSRNLPLLQYWDLPTPISHMCYTQMPAPPALVQHYTKSKMDRWESSLSQVEDLPGVNQSTPPTSWNCWRWNGLWRPSSLITCMGADFTVITDSNPLTYLLTSAKLDATSYRWLSSLSKFTFKIQNRAGSRNQDSLDGRKQKFQMTSRHRKRGKELDSSLTSTWQNNHQWSFQKKLWKPSVSVIKLVSPVMILIFYTPQWP